VAISDDEQWWRRAVIYEVALISFQDSDGDGKGDLPGLLRRVDYLKWLGIDAVWKSFLGAAGAACGARNCGLWLALSVHASCARPGGESRAT
jgi:hypothetical protein